jgi:hypothetical protein
MIVPGRAWLEFEVREDAAGATIRQTALFEPKGIFGLAYWYGLYPIHKLIFRGMLREVAKRAATFERNEQEAAAQGRGL